MGQDPRTRTPIDAHGAQSRKQVRMAVAWMVLAREGKPAHLSRIGRTLVRGRGARPVEIRRAGQEFVPDCERRLEASKWIAAVVGGAGATIGERSLR